MKEASLVSKQPNPAAYKIAKVERPDIPNYLDRKFVNRHAKMTHFRG